MKVTIACEGTGFSVCDEISNLVSPDYKFPSRNPFYKITGENGCFSVDLHACLIQGKRRSVLLKEFLKAIEAFFSTQRSIKFGIKLEVDFTSPSTSSISVVENKEDLPVRFNNYKGFLSNREFFREILLKIFERTMVLSLDRFELAQPERKLIVEPKNLLVPVDRSNERIVCAANRLKDGTILLGVRHWDELMVETYKRIKAVESDLDRAAAEQGFMTNKKRFVTRKEAMVIAKEQNQIYDPKGSYDPEILFSECIY